MTEQKISDTDEKLIQSNVDLCLKCEGLQNDIKKLQRNLAIATTYNDYICALAKKMSTEAKATKFRILANEKIHH